MGNLFTSPPHLPLIAPSILSADFARMGDECAGILAAGADLLHLDVMDGHFAPNLTMGPDMCRAIRRAVPRAFLDVHLMVTDPAKYVRPFVDAGADHLTFHVEAVPEDGLEDLAGRVRAGGATAGLALDPPTPVERVLTWLSLFDLILVMSVKPGFSGQKFMPEVLEKVRTVRPRLRPDQRLEMDGGIGPETAAFVRAAGCDVLVGGSAIFGRPEAGESRRNAISALRGGSRA